MDDEHDFELHRALEEVAPAAVRALIDLATTRGVSQALQEEAVTRLRQIEAAGLMDGLPTDLRTQARRILEA